MVQRPLCNNPLTVGYLGPRYISDQSWRYIRAAGRAGRAFERDLSA